MLVAERYPRNAGGVLVVTHTDRNYLNLSPTEIGESPVHAGYKPRQRLTRFSDGI